jgi:4-amino-4-deoxychorismate lyase
MEFDSEVAELGAMQQAGIVKVLVTAGAGRGYRTDGNAARRIVTAYPPSAPVVDHRIGATVRICRMRLATQLALAGLKHLNRFEQILARAERNGPGITEGLMCDVDGRLIEGIATNLFFVRDGRIVTPDLQRCGVARVMRRGLIEERPGSMRRSKFAMSTRANSTRPTNVS